TALQQFRWPGNIRQLENVLQQAVLLSRGTELRLEDLPPAVRQKEAERPAPVPLADGLTLSRELHERTTIQRALQECGNRRGEAAKILGISRVALWKKMKKHGIDALQLCPN